MAQQPKVRFMSVRKVGEVKSIPFDQFQKTNIDPLKKGTITKIQSQSQYQTGFQTESPFVKQQKNFKQQSNPNMYDSYGTSFIQNKLKKQKQQYKRQNPMMENVFKDSPEQKKLKLKNNQPILTPTIKFDIKYFQECLNDYQNGCFLQFLQKITKQTSANEILKNKIYKIKNSFNHLKITYSNLKKQLGGNFQSKAFQTQESFFFFDEFDDILKVILKNLNKRLKIDDLKQGSILSNLLVIFKKMQDQENNKNVVQQQNFKILQQNKKQIKHNQDLLKQVANLNNEISRLNQGQIQSKQRAKLIIDKLTDENNKLKIQIREWQQKCKQGQNEQNQQITSLTKQNQRMKNPVSEYQKKIKNLHSQYIELQNSTIKINQQANQQRYMPIPRQGSIKQKPSQEYYQTSSDQQQQRISQIEIQSIKAGKKQQSYSEKTNKQLNIKKLKRPIAGDFKQIKSKITNGQKSIQKTSQIDGLYKYKEPAIKKKVNKQSQPTTAQNNTRKQQVQADKKNIKKSKIIQNNSNQTQQMIDKYTEQIQTLQQKIQQTRIRGFLQSSTLIAYEDTIKKYQIMSRIHLFTRGQISQFRMLYRFNVNDVLNFHPYIDNARNLLLVVQLESGQIVGGYSREALVNKKGLIQIDQRGFIFSLSQNHSSFYSLKQNGYIYCPYDQNYFSLGNSQIRIRVGQKQVYSNFGIPNGCFDAQKDSIKDFWGQNTKNNTDRTQSIIGYEFYQVIIDKEQ